MRGKTVIRYKSAINGRFVRKSYAMRHKRTTVGMRVRIGRRR